MMFIVARTLEESTQVSYYITSHLIVLYNIISCLIMLSCENYRLVSCCLSQFLCLFPYLLLFCTRTRTSQLKTAIAWCTTTRYPTACSPTATSTTGLTTPLRGELWRTSAPRWACTVWLLTCMGKE